LPDLHIIDAKIHTGDYFFLCSDGILEGISEEALIALLGDKAISNEEKIEKIKLQCSYHANDNYSAYLIEID